MAFSILPPSPALSECDSLAGIDDLDAFLAAQGPLSIFPTPEIRNVDLECAHYLEPVACSTHQLLATTKAEQASSRGMIRLQRITSFDEPTECFITLVQTTLAQGHCPSDGFDAMRTGLVKASLPVELLALSHAIIERYVSIKAALSTESISTALLVLSCLVLAETHLNDHPRHPRSWAFLLPRTTELCARELNSTILSLLRDLNWSIHDLCTEAMVSRFVSMSNSIINGQQRHGLPKLHTRQSSTTLWLFGQLTPAEHSPHPVLDVAATQPNFFLPLL